MTDTLRDRLGAAIDMAFYEAEQHIPAKDGHCDKCGFCHCSVGHVLAMAQEGVHNALAAQPAPAVMGEDAQAVFEADGVTWTKAEWRRQRDWWAEKCREAWDFRDMLSIRVEGLEKDLAARTAAAESREDALKIIWHGTTDSHGTNDSKECSTGRVYTDPLMQQAYDEGFAHGARHAGNRK